MEATVSDGRLTIDAIGGTNTKLNYVVISPTAPADTEAPDAPVITAPAADAYDSDGDLVIAGTAEAGSAARSVSVMPWKAGSSSGAPGGA